MAGGKRYQPEQVVNLLRQIKVALVELPDLLYHCVLS
jgi:hypothetical protein